MKRSVGHKQKGNKLKLFFLVIAVVVLVEVVALCWLYFSVSSYKSFWKNKANESGEITYLALGDSAAQGIGASSPMRGYVGLIADRLEQKTGKKVKIVNLSVTGAKINDVIRDQIPHIQSIDADVVTIEAGANDIRDFNAEQFELDLSRLLTFLPKETYVSDMPLFNSRPSSTGPAKQASQIIHSLVNKKTDLNLVELERQTTNNQSIFGFAPDLFHPNNLSYKHWADAFWGKIEPSDRIQ
jgi:lysophospholipase L1-like esterase